jgi:hypothetical protein
MPRMRHILAKVEARRLYDLPFCVGGKDLGRDSPPPFAVRGKNFGNRPLAGALVTYHIATAPGEC